VTSLTEELENQRICEHILIVRVTSTECMTCRTLYDKAADLIICHYACAMRKWKV
jgi:hypothetical protein